MLSGKSNFTKHNYEFHLTAMFYFFISVQSRIRFLESNIAEIISFNPKRAVFFNFIASFGSQMQHF